MNIFSYTGKGLREKNEDYLICKDLADKGVLCVVADGMGGYSFGEDASKIVADTIYQTLAVSSKEDIDAAILCANAALHSYKQAKHIEATGCTIAGAIIRGRQAKVFWAGDSRVYLFRGNRIIYQTEDHSLVNEMKQVRVLTPEQIERYEHIVRRSIMGSQDDIVDIDTITIETGDDILICTDGLYKDMPAELAVIKLREQGHSFSVENDKFRDNHSLIYITI